MPDNISNATQSFSWFNKEFLTVTALALLGWTYRTLISDEQFKWKRFFAEGVGAVITGIIIYSAGLMQGLSEPQMVFMGAMGGLGTIRSIEHGLKMMRDLRLKP